MKSFILYHGPAAKPYRGTVTAVVFQSNDNPKTGKCIALAILPGDGVDAMSARSEGRDIACCGSCTLRSIASGGNGGCYVSPLALMGYAGSAESAWKQSDPYAMPDDVPLLPLRLGAYGDPAAIPADAFRRLISWHDGLAGSVWGYTHGWRHSNAQHLRMACMASVETPEQQAQAVAKGWRVYRIIPGLDALQGSGLSLCESDTGTACVDCGACSGSSARNDNGRAIVVHGASRKRATASLGVES